MGRRATAEELSLLNGGDQVPAEPPPYYLQSAEAPAAPAPKRRRATPEELKLLNATVPVATESSPVQAAAPKLPQTSGLESAGRGALDAATLGFDDEGIGALRALGAKLTGDETPFGDLYRAGRDSERLKKRAAQQSNPWTYGLSGLAPAAAMAFIPGGQGAGLTALRALGTGALYGGVGGLGGSEADLTKGDFGGAAKDTAGGAAVGGALGLALHGILPKVGTGLVTPTAEARALRDRGVNLTIGQNNPRGLANSLEQANALVAGAGPGITAQREAALRQARDLVAQESAPIGAQLSRAPAKMNERMGELKNLFDEGYDAIRRSTPQDIAPIEDMRSAFRSAAQRPGAGATRSEREVADEILQDTLTAPKTQRGTPTIGELINVRSRIRKEIESAGDRDRAKILKDAERMVTEDLDRLLPEEQASKLRGLDSRYANYSILKDAVEKAGDTEGGAFSPFKLSQAIKQHTRTGYDRGLGRLRDLSMPMAEVFQKAPETGARTLAVIGSSPGVRIPVAFGNYLLNTRPIKNMVLGQTLPQRAASTMASAIKNNMGPMATGFLAADAGAASASPNISVMDPEEFRRRYGRSPWE